MYTLIRLRQHRTHPIQALLGLYHFVQHRHEVLGEPLLLQHLKTSECVTGTEKFQRLVK